MSQVLLIDDELLVIEAIKCNVDWDACGVSRVFLCDNGFEAQTIMNTHEIDLVISDVQMPGMDGLDFARWVREYFPDVALLFISGYAEFEYARTAITLGAEDYVLKPVNYPALQEQVNRIMSAREKERKQKLNIDYKRWLALLEERNTNQLEAFMESLTDSIYIDGREDSELLQTLYNHFDQILYSYIAASFETRFVILQDEKLSRLKSEAPRSAEHFRAFYRYLFEKIGSNPDNEESKNVIQDVVKYIDAHIGEKVYRSQLADLVFYNENYLSRRFREEVGCSISTYIMEKRLEVSKKLLMQTRLSITEIGEQVGYDNTAYFIRIFKQQTGKTPNEFRKDRKIQKNLRV